ncbi:glycosyl transferase, partial [Streptomyces albireticuli]|nr:glycosyl transferase [Streptomyces albireticuli]
LGWAGVFGLCLVASVVWGHAYPAMRVWAVLALVTALGPMGVWGAGVLRRRRSEAAVGRAEGSGRGAGLVEVAVPVGELAAVSAVDGA